MARKVRSLKISVQSGTTDTLYASWKKPSNSTNLDHYRVVWLYKNSGTWFTDSDEEITTLNSTYSYPDNATSVKVKVKPVAKKNSNGKKYWTGEYSSVTYAKVSTSGVPEKLGAPDMDLNDNGQKITMSYSNITDSNCKKVQFNLIRQDNVIALNETVTVSNGVAKVSNTCAKGYQFRGQARGYNDSIKEYGDWSDYSDWVETEPTTPTWDTYYASDDEEIYLKWNTCSTADSYEIAYATSKSYLQSASGDYTTISTDEDATTKRYYYLTGLSAGETYYFMIRAVNSDGVNSDWSSIVSVVLGTTAEAPTTWSSTTTAMLGDMVYLYWVHNCEDSSTETEVVLQIYFGTDDINAYYGAVVLTVDVANQSVSASIGGLLNGSGYSIDFSDFSFGEDYGDASYFILDLSESSVLYSYLEEGAVITWSVATAGVNGEVGDLSVTRTIDVYAEPSVSLTISDGTSSDTNTSSTDTTLYFSTENIVTLTTFPIYVSAETSPDTQSPVGYDVVITAFETYETYDIYGDDMTVFEGDEVYSEYFSTNESLDLTLTPSDVDLQGGVYYQISVTAAMNSGLTASISITFSIEWEDVDLDVDAMINVNTENGYTAEITPLCYDEDGNDYTDIYFNVYRRDFDGGYTAIETEIDSGNDVTVIDPHPALDYARYRVIAISNDTGAMNYADLDSDPIDGKYVIIQWDENWKTLNVDPEIYDDMYSPAWEGSLLELKYNIDVSDNYDPESSLVEYIGRDYPVGYYGTQKGHTATWAMDVPDTDTETLYGLRRLAIYMGDVYVREPSGSGYWANVKVSFSQTHCERNIPVTLELTRVEGDA